MKDLCHKENSKIQPYSKAPAEGGGCGEALIPTAGAQPPLSCQLLSFPESPAAGRESLTRDFREQQTQGVSSVL